ncbi:hypothetical protein niasHT_022848 [Heterodera trifolii]|uniref:Uncharacterized protein n=1 Tax=Heterodera trifolii TaxID=157864 RepID=A0ABD2K6T7_9BILA
MEKQWLGHGVLLGKGGGRLGAIGVKVDCWWVLVMLFLPSPPPLPAGWSFFAFARTHGRPEEPADRRDTSGTPPPHISGCECVIVVVAVVGAAWPAADQRNLIVVFWSVGQGSVRPSAPPSAGPIKAPI